MKHFAPLLAEEIAKKTSDNKTATIIVCNYGRQVKGSIIFSFYLQQGNMSELADALKAALEDSNIRCEVKKYEEEPCDMLFVVPGIY